MAGMMGLDIQTGGYAPGSLQVVPGQDGMYMAVNPKTGKLEPLYNDNDTSRMYFASDGPPPSASRAGPLQYFSADPSTFDNFMERATLGGLAAIAGAGMAGAGAGGSAAGEGGAAAGEGSAVAGGTSAGGTGAAASGGGDMGVIDIFGSTEGAPAFSTDAGLWSQDPAVLDMFGSTAGAPGYSMDPATYGGDAQVLDMFGSTPGNPGWSSDPGAWDPSTISGGGLSLGNMPGWINTLRGLFSGGLGGASSFLPSGQQVGSMLPGLLALGYAGRQSGIDTSGLQSIEDQLAGNQGAVVKAATDPVQANIAAGYGDLIQRLGKRGVLGSSFGNTDIANYMDITGRTLGDVGATATQKSLGLQGDLAGQIASLKAKSQELKNNLYGRAFDTLGRGLNPRGYGGLSLTGP